MAARSPGSTVLLGQAAADLEKAIVFGDPSQKVQAQNSLGILHLQQKNYDRAYRTFSAIPVAQVEPAQRFVYYYNIARSLDLKGDGSTAYANYLMSFRENPRSPAAPSRAYDLLLAGRVAPPVARAVELASELVNTAQGSLAAELIRRGLDAWGSDTEAKSLLIPLLRYYARSQVGAREFVSAEWPALEPLVSKHAGLAAGLSEIRDAYTKEFEPLATPVNQAFHPAFPFWSGAGLPPQRADEGRVAFSSLLSQVGNYYFNRLGQKDASILEGNPASSAPDFSLRMAYTRYSAAWAIDRGNTDAAFAGATVLHDYSDKLDPGHRLYDQLINSMFDVKAAEVRRTSQDSRRLAEHSPDALRPRFDL